MKKQTYLSQHCMKVFLFLFVCIFFLEGCEPLRKKFIRKKKEDQSTQHKEVVFKTEDYAPENYTAAENYEKNYNLWVIWGKSLEEALNHSENEKRYRYFMEQGLRALTEMSLYLKKEKKGELDEMIQEFHELNKEFMKPYALWNKVRIRTVLNSNSIKIRTRFNPRELQGYFVDQ